MSCKHKFTRGRLEGQTCQANGVHEGGYCYKHKKLVVPDKINKAVTGGSEKPVDKPVEKKVKFSSFKITVNSNNTVTKLSVAQINEFKELIKFVFSKDNIIEYLIDKTNADSSKNLVKVESDFYYEIAPGNKSLHSHGLIRLTHTGFYKLDLELIKGIIDGVLGKKSHVHVAAAGDPDAAWEAYMRKNQSAEKI